ncbi:hypothetical protein PTKIN_Ptkin04bG0088400 [Pterospermum kingtungense]
MQGDSAFTCPVKISERGGFGIKVEKEIWMKWRRKEDNRKDGEMSEDQLLIWASDKNKNRFS